MADDSVNVLELLHWTQRHWETWIDSKTKQEPKPRVEWFSECAVEGVEVDQLVTGDLVEGQSASRIVHIHRYSVRVRGGREGEDNFSVVVPDRVTTSRAAQTPGLIISSKPAVGYASFPSDTTVTHWYKILSLPLNLPVTAASQTIRTQQLTAVVKSLWVIRVWLVI